MRRAFISKFLAVGSILIVGSASTAAIDTPAASASAKSVPTQIRASYKISRNGIALGSIVETFVRSGDRYKITSVTRTEGVIALLYKDELTVISAGKITGAGLQPEQFSYARAASPKRNFTNTFNWDKRELERIHDGERETFPIPTGALDRLSVLYQFVAKPPQGDSVTTWMTNGREAERYLYLNRGEQLLSTPAGMFPALWFQRDAKPGESKAQLWLAKESGYVPIRVIFEESNGTVIEQSLVSLSVQ